MWPYKVIEFEIADGGAKDVQITRADLIGEFRGHLVCVASARGQSPRSETNPLPAPLAERASYHPDRGTGPVRHE